MHKLHPVSAVTLALQRGIVGLTIPLFLLSALAGAVEWIELTWGFVLVPIGFVVGVAYGVAYYSRFAYGLTEDTFDIDSGVISRRSREIPYRRVQNVDVRQGVLFTLLGLAIVRVETAGGGDSEATLNFVDEREAERLQREIRRRTAAVRDRRNRSGSADAGRSADATDRDADATDRAADATDRAADATGEAATADRHTVSGATTRTDTASAPRSADADPDVAQPRESRGGERVGEPQSEPLGSPGRPRTLFELAGRELSLYSFASFRPAAAAGLLFVVLFASEFVLEYLIAAAQPVGGPAELGAGRPASYLVLSAVSAAHAVVITYVFSFLYTFVAYYGFRLGRAGDDLVYERGLLQRYSGSIPLEKVQSVTITDNPIQRRIGYAGLWIETAGYGPDSSSGGSQSAIPLASVPRVQQFTERLSGVDPPQFRRPTTVARRRYLARYGIVATVFVGVALGVSAVTAFDAWYLAAFAYLAVPPAAHLKWIHLGYYLGDDHVVIRSGFWRRQTAVIPYYRVQTVSVRRSIFQRRLGIASLVVDTASSRTFFWTTPTVYDVDLAVARRIRDHSRERLQVAQQERSRGHVPDDLAVLDGDQ